MKLFSIALVPGSTFKNLIQNLRLYQIPNTGIFRYFSQENYFKLFTIFKNAALNLEKEVNQSLLDLHALSSSKNDAHLSDFLESEYLDEQVNASKELGDMITQMKRAGPGIGEYLFDKELQSRTYS